MQVIVRIKRQRDREETPYWESFALNADPTDNVVSLLMQILESNRNAAGDVTPPVSWESACLEDVCGACSMVINGKPRQACSSLVADLGEEIALEPMTVFPVVRDLIVDRTSLFQGLKTVKAWAPEDGLWEEGEGPTVLPEDQQKEFALSQCFSCGICLEVCPIQKSEESFIGAMAVGQAYRHNINVLGKSMKEERIDALSEIGNIDACDNDLSCHRACPKGVPLKEALETLKNASAWSWF